MAHLYKGDGVVAVSTSPLARAPWDRLIDVYKLAKLGSADCRRMWTSYAAEVPGTARLVVKSVEAERAEDARVTVKIDKRLRRAENRDAGGKKPVKVTKGRKKAPGPVRGELDAVLAIADPARREFEYGRLTERRVQG